MRDDAFASAATLFDSDQPAQPPVFLSYGLGVDSTAILLRWITDPASRDFPLEALTVVTSMTGDEFASTGDAVERVVLPYLRSAGVRFVQVARSQRKTTAAGEGVAVLDDSCQPRRLHLDGAYKLSQEMLSCGTVPQLGGARLCSVHGKGNALDPSLSRLAAGRAYLHAMGFEVGESARAAKDATYNTRQRTGFYPLLDWGWDRQRCLDFIAALTGERWQKSACSYCPFAMSSARGRAGVVERFRIEPQAGADALFMEHVARSLNPHQTLVAGSSAAHMVATAGLGEVLASFEARIGASVHAIYRVRRVTPVSSRRPGRPGTTSRSVQTMCTGSRDEMAARLADMPGRTIVGANGIARRIVRDRTQGLPRLEEFYVACPAVVADKARPQFEEQWYAATTTAVLC